MDQTKLWPSARARGAPGDHDSGPRMLLYRGPFLLPLPLNRAMMGPKKTLESLIWALVILSLLTGCGPLKDLGKDLGDLLKSITPPLP